MAREPPDARRRSLPSYRRTLARGELEPRIRGRLSYGTKTGTLDARTQLETSENGRYCRIRACGTRAFGLPQRPQEPETRDGSSRGKPGAWSHLLHYNGRAFARLDFRPCLFSDKTKNQRPIDQMMEGLGGSSKREKLLRFSRRAAARLARTTRIMI